ncbi:hypothetical protein ACFXPW_04885 [Streptomyces goshikiensis]|uniref:hypothetical protein n=1 Tax=Streptomyces goshikiensis TaxID=1942 RepID=UPI00367436E3
MPDWLFAVLAAAAVLLCTRSIRVSGAGLRLAVLYVVVMNALMLWVVWKNGPSWSLPAVGAVSLVTAVYNLLAAARTMMSRIQRIGVPVFRTLVRRVADARGPQVMGVCVLFSGIVVLTAFTDDEHPEGVQFHVLPGQDCPFCLLEDQIRDFLGEADPLLDAYRGHLRAGSSRHLLVRRASAADAWTGRLRDRVYYRVPSAARRPPCPVHDPLLAA